MKLNKLQRYTAYCIMLHEITLSNTTYGFCIWIDDLFELGEDYDEKVIKKYFPELWNKKPKKVYREESYAQGCVWFGYDGNKQRTELLKQCIQETHPP